MFSTLLLAALTAAAEPCPLAEWKGPCHVISEVQKDRIREVVSDHIRGDVPECREMRDVLLSWLDREAWVVWVFSGTTEDRGKRWVGGHTGRDPDTNIAQAVGFSRKIFTLESGRMASIVIHEAVHLSETQRGEERAERVAKQCVLEIR